MLQDNVVVVDQLSITFPSRDGTGEVVHSVSFEIRTASRIGLVGESGSGKSLTARAIMNLVPPPGRVSSGQILLNGKELGTGELADPTSWRGNAISMITQDPLSSLNPLVKIGRQMTEMLIHHRDLSKIQAKEKSISLLTSVGIPNPSRTLRQFPSALSGGMRQRIALAIAISCEPRLLIADEPTTALDVTIQAQVLDLLEKMTGINQTAVLLISHDLGVVANFCEDLLVMYGGRIVESGPTRDLIASPQHPYTRALLASVPDLDGEIPERLSSISGSPPVSSKTNSGCSFAPRCSLVRDVCRSETPALTAVSGESREVACHAVGSHGWQHSQESKV